MLALVDWAIRAREPLCQVSLRNIKGQWQGTGMELTFEGGKAVIANFEGVIVEDAWQRMDEFERYQFCKDCTELLGKNLEEVATLDRGYLLSLFHLLKECEGERRILIGEGVNFEHAMANVGLAMGTYYDLGNLGEGVWAVAGNYRQTKMLERAFMDSLEYKVYCF